MTYETRVTTYCL